MHIYIAKRCIKLTGELHRNNSFVDKDTIMDIDNVLEKRKQLMDEQGGYTAVRERLLLAMVYFAFGLRK